MRSSTSRLAILDIMGIFPSEKMLENPENLKKMNDFFYSVFIHNVHKNSYSSVSMASSKEAVIKTFFTVPADAGDYADIVAEVKVYCEDPAKSETLYIDSVEVKKIEPSSLKDVTPAEWLPDLLDQLPEDLQASIFKRIGYTYQKLGVHHHAFNIAHVQNKMLEAKVQEAPKYYHYRLAVTAASQISKTSKYLIITNGDEVYNEDADLAASQILISNGIEIPLIELKVLTSEEGKILSSTFGDDRVIWNV